MAGQGGVVSCGALWARSTNSARPASAAPLNTDTKHPTSATTHHTPAGRRTGHASYATHPATNTPHHAPCTQNLHEAPGDEQRALRLEHRTPRFLRLLRG